MPARMKTAKPTICGSTYQSSASCAATMSTSESEPAMRITPSTESASDTSYETSCAQVRIDPRRENFESDAQPPTMKP